MIFDGKWKNELKRLSWEISFWRKITILNDLAEHRLNRAILYSAAILRKIIEDEKEAEAKTEAIAKEIKISPPKLITIHSSLEAIKYPYTGEEGWAIRGKLCALDYGKGHTVCVKAKDVCNWILHSYVWGVACNEDRKTFTGFLVASDFDKEKFVHFMPFDEWSKLIQLVINEKTF
ncbi:MAG: hypothetical protein IKU45_02940 [Clostridia bacterium]|nr:hypothetical protein [Clostridia bacterium]